MTDVKKQHSNDADEAARMPYRALDRLSKPMIKVPLKNGGTAVVDVEDFERLVKGGLSPKWFLNGTGSHQYVRAPSTTKGGLVGVARLIAGAKEGEIVKYKNGDRTCLLRRNLEISKGFSRRVDMKVLDAAAKNGRAAAAGRGSAQAAAAAAEKALKAVAVDAVTAAEAEADAEKAAVRVAMEAPPAPVKDGEEAVTFDEVWATLEAEGKLVA